MYAFVFVLIQIISTVTVEVCIFSVAGNKKINSNWHTVTPLTIVNHESETHKIACSCRILMNNMHMCVMMSLVL